MSSLEIGVEALFGSIFVGEENEILFFTMDISALISAVIFRRMESLFTKLYTGLLLTGTSAGNFLRQNHFPFL